MSTADESNDDFSQSFDASDGRPVPPGLYEVIIVPCGLVRSEIKQTPGYRLVFQIVDGPQAGRQIIHSIWLLKSIMWRAKRDLGMFGFTKSEQLKQPLRQLFRGRAQVTIRLNDRGLEENEIAWFSVRETLPDGENPFRDDDPRRGTLNDPRF